MPKFKVGDRVELTEDAIDNAHLRAGSKGTVLEEDGFPFVQWDGFTDGHDNGDPSVPSSSWGVEETNLKKIKKTKSTQKPKEPKTMTATKKPGTTHGKPTAKGMKVEKKPTAAKVSKYPEAREVLGIMIPDYRNPKSKATKSDLVDQVFDLLDTALDARKDLATTGTKLDRVLVDLKEAKKRIKELERKMSGESI